MPLPRCSREEFVELFRRLGADKTAKELKTTPRAVYKRRKYIENELGITILSPHSLNTRLPVERKERKELEVQDGYVLIGSDIHIWPDIETVAMKGLVKFCKKLQPKVVILNGDVMDFPSISRWNPLGWENRPLVVEELKAAQEWTNKVVNAAPNAERVWTLGNHDARFEATFAKRIPEAERVHGLHLKDHFPYWEGAQSCWINDDVCVKHRWKGGIHAAWRNVVESGVSIVTGHLHNPSVRPYTDYRGTRFGVDGGMTAYTFGPQFTYLEDNPRNWRSAFTVLKFVSGVLLVPQLARVHNDDAIDYCNELTRVQ